MFRIKERREDLVNFVTRLPEETLNIKPNGTGWTVLEVLEHLYRIEDKFAEIIHKALNQAEGEPAPKQKPIHLTLERSAKVQAPDNLKPSGKFNTLNEALGALNSSRAKLNQALDEQNIDTLSSRSSKHPSFGRMNLDQWVEFIGLHEVRHLEQIKELVQLKDKT